MDAIGVNAGFLIVQLLGVALLGGGLVLCGWGLWGLSRRVLPPVAQALWVAIIVLVPLLGPLAFWMIKPGEPKL